MGRRGKRVFEETLIPNITSYVLLFALTEQGYYLLKV